VIPPCPASAVICCFSLIKPTDRALIFSMKPRIYQDCSNYCFCMKIDTIPGGHKFSLYTPCIQWKTLHLLNIIGLTVLK
jgi:hypothetical protein